DGSLGPVRTLGASSDPFVDELHVAAGAGGAAAVTWRTGADQPSTLAYRPAGGGWQPAAPVPSAADVAGLVVGATGAAAPVLTTGSAPGQHLTYLRRTASGAWRSPATIASGVSAVSVAGNADGDIGVAWDVANGDGTADLLVRYRPSGGSGFRPSHHLAD